MTVRVLIGGVGYRWQGDSSFGLAASDALSEQEWPPGVAVADLGYGAIYVSQDIADAQPPYQRLVLLAGMPRGRPAGQLYAYRWQPATVGAEELQARIREAGAGVIDLDHLLAIANFFNALPPEVNVLEYEPASEAAGESLTAQASACLPHALALARLIALAPAGQPDLGAERSPEW
jgi:hydrogenase maturation protease